MNELAERYAEAIFSLAREKNTVRELKEEAENLSQVLETSPELIGFFRAVKITSAEKKDLIQNVFGPVFDKDMVNFMKLLIDKGRIYSLKDILKAIVHKANDELGIQEALVYSARKLQDTDLERIRKALETKTGRTVVLKNRIDESLIAGIKVVVGNNVTDVTMKHKLEEMKASLLKGGGQA
ncbi:MAG TPA: hypothetical protein DCG51_04355 [Erysipelotrichaceae bacterium]|nr:F0F1 ATP synthase subunit delta [Solobacterium sp.]HAE15762.1 hypothetical protein [Erysipelotrichaceae bacterium]